METENLPDITVALWNNIHEFQDGVQKTYETEEFDEDRFYSFVDRLAEYHPSFRKLSEGLQDGMIAFGTPKPEQMHFTEECIMCGEEIENQKPHIERTDESTHEFICIDCFFKIPYTENQFNS